MVKVFAISAIVVMQLAVSAVLAAGPAEADVAHPAKKPTRGPSRLHPPTMDASAAGAKAIELFDTNEDGKISGAELNKCPGVKAALAQIDPSGDKTVTAEKITARIKAWQASKLGRMSLSCTVLHNGKPLKDAEVKFLPEAFLGKNIQAGSGKTDRNGVAMVSIPTNSRLDPPGMAPGLYRVEIRKADEEIPAKYNSETILGQEIALDAEGIQNGIRFDLKY